MQALKPIKTENEYKAALKALGAFFDNNPDNADQDTADYFEVLATLVETYEKEHNVASVIKFAIEEYTAFMNALADTNLKENEELEIIEA